MLCCILIAVVVMCGPDDFIYRFMTKASSNDMLNGIYGEFMYLSIRTVNSDTLHPWSVRERNDPSKSTLKAFRHLIQVI